MNSTAPVHEFRCLYTHDLRRKQKRWQDGFLKYHTFNKRAMVYDTLRNFIGDTHWQASDGVGEGDEVELEAGVVVQVGEQVGLSETDLRPIFERPRNRGGEGMEKRGGVGTGGVEVSNAVRRPREILRHKSLNALLGTAKGTLGKAALPTRSPFELNNGAAEEETRAAKRQRRDAQPMWTVTRVTTPAKASKRKETPLRARVGDVGAKRASAMQSTRNAAPRIDGQMSLKVKEVIDITSDNDDNTPTYIARPSMPPPDASAVPVVKPSRKPAVPTSWRRNSPPPLDPSPQPSSPPVSTRNKIVNVDPGTPPGTVDITGINQGTDRHPSPQNNSRLKPIRLTKSKPRNMLLCEKNNPKIVKTKSAFTVEKAGCTAHTSTVLSDQPEAKRKDQEKGPWTIEALDFFDWRPPDWDARVKQKALEFGG